MMQENNQKICDCSYNSSPQQTSNQSISRFHEIRVLPVYKHMFDEKRENQASYDDRLAMCQLAFQDIPNVVVSDDERRCFHWAAKKHGVTTTQDKLKLRVGTADLLDMLLEEDDSLEITLALGADTFMDLTRWKWKRSKDIIRLIEGRMIVFQRIFHSGESVQTNVDESTHSGNNSWITHEDLLERIEVISDEFKDAHPNLKDQIILVKLPFLSSVSSSKVRSCTTEDDLLVFVEEEQLDRRVFEFITENKLYGMNNSQKVEQKNEHFL